MFFGNGLNMMVAINTSWTPKAGLDDVDWQFMIDDGSFIAAIVVL
jgi:hypothetical protein